MLRDQLSLTSARAAEFIEIRVPSRKRDVIEFVPDVDLAPREAQVLAAGSVAAATAVLPQEDFRDWEK